LAPRIKSGAALVGDDCGWLDASGARSVEVKTARETLAISPERIEEGQCPIRVRHQRGVTYVDCCRARKF
jgi:hypothetical protein